MGLEISEKSRRIWLIKASTYKNTLVKLIISGWINTLKDSVFFTKQYLDLEMFYRSWYLFMFTHVHRTPLVNKSTFLQDLEFLFVYKLRIKAANMFSNDSNWILIIYQEKNLIEIALAIIRRSCLLSSRNYHKRIVPWRTNQILKWFDGTIPHFNWVIVCSYRDLQGRDEVHTSL